MRLLLLAALAAFAPTAGASPRETVVLHMATIAPDGSDWARLARSFARDVEARSNGRIRVKWTFGGIAGDEPTVLERIERGELDGAAGAMVCERLAPSLRALEIVGLVENDAEATAVLHGLEPTARDELRTTPFRGLMFSTGFGHRVLFSRAPVRSLEDLRRGRWFIWNLDDVLGAQRPKMGVHVVPLPLGEAVAAYDAGRVDGFIVIPAAALAWGYYTHAHAFTDLESAFLPGCVVVGAHALDQLSPADQLAMHEAGAALRRRFEEVGRRLDDALLGHDLAKAGLLPVPMSPGFRASLYQAGQAAAAALGDRLAPQALLDQVRAILRARRQTEAKRQTENE